MKKKVKKFNLSDKITKQGRVGREYYRLHVKYVREAVRLLKEEGKKDHFGRVTPKEIDEIFGDKLIEVKNGNST